MSTLIVITIVALVILLGRYAIAEGQRIERNKKFMKNMNNYDKKRK